MILKSMLSKKFEVKLLFHCIYSFTMFSFFFSFIERVCKKAVRYTGRCSENYVSRFYYDSNTNSCQEFIYSGCPINRFTFIRQDFCEEVCQLWHNYLTVLKIILNGKLDWGIFTF